MPTYKTFITEDDWDKLKREGKLEFKVGEATVILEYLKE